MQRSSRAWKGAVLVLTALSTPLSAQSTGDRSPRLSVGAHAGVDLTDEIGEERVGGQATIPLTGILEFYPLVSVFLTGDFPAGSFTAIGTLRARTWLGTGPAVYGGAGVKFSHVNIDEVLDVALAGVEILRGRLRPFAEVHVFGLIKRGDLSVNLLAGLNLALGR